MGLAFFRVRERSQTKGTKPKMRRRKLRSDVKAKCLKQEQLVWLLPLSAAQHLLRDAPTDAGFVLDTATMLRETIKGPSCVPIL